MHQTKLVGVFFSYYMKAEYCSLSVSTLKCVREASYSLVNSSIHPGKTLSRWISHLIPSHFVNFLKAQEKQNRPMTELNCSALKVVLPALIRL